MKGQHIVGQSGNENKSEDEGENGAHKFTGVTFLTGEHRVRRWRARIYRVNGCGGLRQSGYLAESFRPTAELPRRARGGDGDRG